MESKNCFKCGKTKELSLFYSHPEMADGHLNKCIECTKADVKGYRKAMADRISAYEKSRNQSAKRKAKKLEYQKLSRLRSHQKWRCRSRTSRAVRNGVIEKLPCKYCGEPKVEAHHHDYNKPLEVVWVCFACHRSKEHRQVVIAKNHHAQEAKS